MKSIDNIVLENRKEKKKKKILYKKELVNMMQFFLQKLTIYLDYHQQKTQNVLYIYAKI